MTTWWGAALVAVGFTLTFIALGAFFLYAVHQIFNQDVKHRCPTCGQPTHHDYSKEK